MSDWEAALRRLHFAHLDGDPDAARTALSVCAVTGRPMPRWLVDLILEALDKSRRGRPEEVFGMGSEKARVRLHKRHLRNRDAAIAQDHDYLRGELGESGVIEHLAKLHKLSTKGLETAMRRAKRKAK